MQGIIAFLVIFTIIVAIHEYGHYYFGKKFNVLVREFAIGVGPKLWQRKGEETTYTLRLIPAGAYVAQAGFEAEEHYLQKKMPIYVHLDENGVIDRFSVSEEFAEPDMIPFQLVDFDLNYQMTMQGILTGQEQSQRYQVDRYAFVIDEDGLEQMIAPYDRQIQSKTVWQRFWIYFAGPLNNFILSIFVFTLMAFVMGEVPVDDPIIGEVVQDSVAQKAGIEAGDEITQVNGEAISSWVDLSTAISTHPDENLDFTIDRNGEIINTNVTPTLQETKDGQTYGQVGIMRATNNSFLSKIVYGFTQTWAVISGVFLAIASMFTKGFNINNFGGPVAIYNITSEAAAGGFLPILYWLGYLSANIGMVNLFPLPVLDGGRILLVFIEGIIGKPVPLKFQQALMAVASILILILLIAVTWNDLSQLF